MILRGRLKGFQRMQLGYLLDMLYTPSELSKEVGFTVRQVLRVYLPLGCPCVRDRGRIYVNGKVFADWYNSTYPKQALQVDEGFCLTCKKAVKISDPILNKSGRLSYSVFKCPHCGRKISRIIDRER